VAMGQEKPKKEKRQVAQIAAFIVAALVVYRTEEKWDWSSAFFRGFARLSFFPDRR